MNDSLPHPTPKRRRWLPRGFLVLGALIFGAIAYFWYQHDKSERELQAAIAETDRLDPGWRLADLEAARPEIPFEENSAPLIKKVGVAAITALNKGKVRENLNAITDELTDLPPTVRLDARQAATLRAALIPLAGSLDDARNLAELPRGRHPFNVSPGVSEPIPHADHAGIAIWLLTEDARLRAHEGDMAAAWRACQAIQNICRSFAGEPLGVIQTIRVVHRQHGLRLMERLLAQGEVAEQALTATQKPLEEEASEQPLLLALRAHRAAAHHLYTQLAGGRASLAEAQQVAAGNFSAPTWREQAQAFFGRGSIKPAHAWLLRYYNRAVEIAKGPPADVKAALEEHAAGHRPPGLATSGVNLDRFVSPLSPAKVQAQLACACSALAVERFRLKHKRWAAALDDLVAEGLLKEVPADPYDGQPLRYRPTKDGVVVYSVGPDGKGAGDALERQPIDAERLEFRLWNVERRRR